MITCKLRHSFLLIHFKQNLTSRQEYPAYEIPLKILRKIIMALLKSLFNEMRLTLLYLVINM